jgi:hypothetical protein
MQNKKVSKFVTVYTTRANKEDKSLQISVKGAESTSAVIGL